MKALIIVAVFIFSMWGFLGLLDMVEGDISFRIFAGCVCLLFCALGGVASVLIDEILP